MTKTTSKKTSTKKTPKKVVRATLTTYVPVSDNIYHDGTSYRVRVVKNGTKISKNFSNKRKAVQFRNELLGK